MSVWHYYNSENPYPVRCAPNPPPCLLCSLVFGLLSCFFRCSVCTITLTSRNDRPQVCLFFHLLHKRWGINQVLIRVGSLTFCHEICNILFSRSSVNYGPERVVVTYVLTGVELIMLGRRLVIMVRHSYVPICLG